MFVKKIALCMILFCLASLFVGVPFVEAHSDTDTGTLREAARQRNNAWDERDRWSKRYTAAKGVVDGLLSAWDDNADAIKDGTWDTVNIFVATLISELIRHTNNDDGKSSTQKLIEALPSIWGAVNLVKSSVETSSVKGKRDEYLSALSSAVSAFNEIISENEAAFKAYETKYDAYVVAMQDHDGGIDRETNYSGSTNYTALDIEVIKKMVKAKDAYNPDDKKNKLEFWYHIDDLKSSSQPSVFGFDRFKDFDTYWKLDPLEKKYKCGGGCGQKYETPVRQLVTCPYPLTSSTLQVSDTKTLRNLPIDAKLNGKPAPAGCGHMFYLCSVSDRDEHRVRVCGKLLKDGTKCGALYRNCSNTKIKHDGWFKSYHGPGKDGLKTYPWDNWFGAVPGGVHKAVLLSLEAYKHVKWYVRSPGETGLGTLVETDMGDGSLVTADFSYTFASNASAGDYLITAVVTNANDEKSESSYTVSVSSSTSSTSTASASLSPSNGAYTAEAGSSHTANVSVPSGWTQIYWYLKSPSESGYGTSQSNVSDSTGNSTSASYTYSFPSGVSGDYVLTAYVYASDGTIVEPSYTVSVSVSSSTTTTTTTTQAPAAPKATPTFSPVVSGLSPSYSAGDTLNLTVNTGAPCYGVYLHINNAYHWFPGGSTSSVSVSYTLPANATGVLPIKLLVYPWEGSTYGTPSRLYESVTVQ